MSFRPFEPGCLNGQVALITGAGGGIGRAVAHRLAGLGASLALTDIGAGSLEATANSLPDVDRLTRTADLTDEAVVKELVEAVLTRYGRLDIAVNAAGILLATPFEQITKAEWDRVMDANAGSTFLVCRECCEPMRRQGYGRIVNIASMAGQLGGVVAGGHYSAAKAAVICITRSVAKLLAPHGVRCNVIAPGGVETSMLNAFNDEQQEALRHSSLIGRLGTPEDIAELIAWLASPACDYVTGQTININGGVYLG